MKKICICGSFGFGKVSLNGQTIKTEIVTDYYRSVLGNEEVLTIDTQGLLNFLILPIRLFVVFFTCKNIVILPAQNSLRIVAPLCRIYQTITSKKTHYLVIGGWLPHYLQKHPFVRWGVKTFSGIYVETNTMKRALEKDGLKNVILLPNCKHLAIENNRMEISCPPLKLCTFSRINRKKGVEDAIMVVNEVNKEYGKVIVKLDIFGRVDEGEKEWFDSILSSLPDGVRYRGAIAYDKSVETLKEYHALLFPTLYYTEGVPGTIIDAYAAGLPVIASKWESCEDVVEHLKTGFIYAFSDKESMKNTLLSIINNPYLLFKMKETCRERAYDYLPENVMNRLKLY